MDGHPDEQRPREAANDQSRIYEDLRRRNERKAGLLRVLEAKRRERVERALQAVRHRKTHQGS